MEMPYPVSVMQISFYWCVYCVQDDRMAAKRQSSEEKRALERAQTDIYSDIRRAAEAHR